MTLRKLFLFCLPMLCQLVCAQQIPVNYLDQVTVSDAKFRKFGQSQNLRELNDSIITKNQPSLTSLLNYNSVIYFKENGLGMVSSPSFRGTTAQQTAVIWNGININSQLNGQTDFNTVTTQDFSSVWVRSGGGSVLYGSSALGGTVHLNSDLPFSEQFSNEIRSQYGSFNTFGLHYGLKLSDGKWSAQLGLSRNSSENDYKYPGSAQKNLNGQFYNDSYNAALGYKVNARNFLKFYSQVFDSQRHFSLASPFETKTKYKDFNTRHLLEWSALSGRFTSKARVAYLSEQYQYFGNIDSDHYSFGKVKTMIGKYDLSYDFAPEIQLNAVADYTQNRGNGSDIQSQKREVVSGSLLFRHLLHRKFRYELGIRKEATSNYDSPVLFSAGTVADLSEKYSLKLNFSRNFRTPTFNDLYWEGAGNPDLKPESSYQGEIGNELRLGDFKVAATVYHSEIRDMIRWVPGNGGLFSPENTHKVAVTGVELLLDFQRRIGRNNFAASGTYAYTDSRNMELRKQLIYVPYHKMTASLAYGIGRFSAAFQHLFTGEVYTQSDNNPKKTVAMYNVSNISADYSFGRKTGLKIGFRILNLWDENYQSVENRPLPGRNFNSYLTFNF